MSAAKFKYGLLLSTVIGSAIVLLAWTQDWFALEMVEVAHGGAALPVSGSAAAPALPALSLAGLALVAALGLAGPVFRVILGALELVLGASVVLEASLALADPVGAGAALVSQVTGVAGSESVAALVAGVNTTVWPFIAIVGGVIVALSGLGVAPLVAAATLTVWPAIAIIGGIVLALGGLGVVLSARRWPRTGRKYQAVRLEHAEGSTAAPGEDFVADWDDLSRGDDPTDVP